MNIQKRDAVIMKVYGMYEEGNTLPAVTLEDFFDGNDDDQSIAVNLDGHPGVSHFRETLQSIKSRGDVQDVFIEIHECPDPDVPEDGDIWMTAMVVFIITSASLEDVRAWVGDLRPNLLHEGWNVEDGVSTPLAQDELVPGATVVRVWWD